MPNTLHDNQYLRPEIEKVISIKSDYSRKYMTLNYIRK